jgi:hypothetical protein
VIPALDSLEGCPGQAFQPVFLRSAVSQCPAHSRRIPDRKNDDRLESRSHEAVPVIVEETIQPIFF